jgi:hypothetical protein
MVGSHAAKEGVKIVFSSDSKKVESEENSD